MRMGLRTLLLAAVAVSHVHGGASRRPRSPKVLLPPVLHSHTTRLACCRGHCRRAQLLGLHGRDSFLLCDITKAYDMLRSMPLVDGYSGAVVAGRGQVLEFIKDAALDNEGRVAADKGIDLPTNLLPSALALLAQVRTDVRAALRTSTGLLGPAHTHGPLAWCRPQAGPCNGCRAHASAAPCPTHSSART